MKESDVVVIGGGLAGLTAAAVSASRGKKVTLLAKGAGTLAFGGGSIDLLGYCGEQPVNNPLQAIDNLTTEHPYRIVGTEQVRQAVDFFIALCRQEGYALEGSINHTMWLPTVVGTLKPSSLVPRSMNPNGLKQASTIVIVNFTGLKDFYPKMVVQGLSRLTGANKNYLEAIVETNLPGSRDITVLDVARWLDTSEGQQSFIEQLQSAITPDVWVLVPPVLGTRPNYQVWEHLQTTLRCRLLELVAPPPAITGSRLRSLLVRYVKKLGVKVVEQSNVTHAICDNGHCQAVVTHNVGREHAYFARSFILATGGILGGGLIASPGKVTEPIFGLPVEVPSSGFTWGDTDLFAAGGQPFARIGIKADSSLRPLDAVGRVLLTNVHVAGNMLAHYDYPQEKSGNGVALVSGYHAALSAEGGER